MTRLAQAREETLDRKLDRAASLLDEGVAVGEVARKINLDIQQLRRAFKRKFGVTPQSRRRRSDSCTVSFKLSTAAELHQLEAAAERAKVSVSTYVRRLVRRSLRFAAGADT